MKRDGTVKDKVRYRNGSGLLYYSFDENILYCVKDKVRYRNGSGLLYYSFDENVLYWTDYTLKPEKRVRSFIKTASPDADEAM